MDGEARPALGRNNFDLAAASRLASIPNDRHHYSLLGFLQKRRGGGGASASASGSEGGSPKSLSSGY